MLLPHYVFDLPKGETRRLIPVPDLPHLVADTSMHAAQAMLQLLVMEEFANKSRNWALNGCILGHP